jgi:hypothetical protein
MQQSVQLLECLTYKTMSVETLLTDRQHPKELSLMMFFQLRHLIHMNMKQFFFCFFCFVLFFFWGQFCDVAEVAIIGKPILANLGY